MGLDGRRDPGDENGPNVDEEGVEGVDNVDGPGREASGDGGTNAEANLVEIEYNADEAARIEKAVDFMV